MTAPIMYRADVSGPPPLCGFCGQPMPWNPPLCTCGHPVSGHDMDKPGKKRLVCTVADQRGPCDCGRYEHASDGHYGPRSVTP